MTSGVRSDTKIVAVFVTLLALAVCSFVSIPAYSQVTGATLSGTLTDPSGGVVAGATITVTNTATGLVRTNTSDASGLYAVTNLIPGTYEVKVAATGFSTAVQSNLILAVGQQQQLNFSLTVGQTTTTVQVTEAAPQVDLTSSALSGQVESETVRELPLNGRDWTQLATLQPGVAKIETQVSYAAAGRGNRGFGAELTVSGQRSTFNNYRIDGISVVDYANAAPGDAIGIMLGVDAIDEFSVLTGGFPAEYGRATGGVVNAISKSGTNSFHGDAYEFLRNSALDARDYFTRAAGRPIPPFRRNQFGVSAGGPIIKDKTFIFADYEGLRQAKGIPTSTTVFSDNARQGIMAAGGPTPTSCPAGSSLLAPNATICVNNYSAALLALWPHANSAVRGDTGRFVNAAMQDVPENFGTVRVDHKLGANDTLFGTYLFDDTDYLQPDTYNDVLTHSHTRRQTIAIEESHTFSASFVNTARVGYNRDYVVNQFTSTAISAAAGDLALGALQGEYAPRLSVHGGISDFFGGIDGQSHFLQVWNSYQYYDDAFWTHGAHTIKFGGGVERMQSNPQTFYEPAGRYQFADYTHFLEGVPKSFEAQLPVVREPRELRQTLFSAYVQDDWKMRSNLTINMGLRYEPSTVLNDAQGRITNLATISATSPTCGTQFTAPLTNPLPGSSCGSVGPYYSNPTLRNFEPRLGFAWDPFKDGKTSVRGSFGIYDVDPVPGYFFLQQNQAAPFIIVAKETAFSTQPGFVTPFDAGEGGVQLTNLTSARLGASTIEGHPHRSYVSEWNLNIQRQIMSDTTITVGYVGSRGVHLMTRGDDGNMSMPTYVPGIGYEFPCGYVGTGSSCTAGTTGGVQGTGGATNAQINPLMGSTRYIFWNANSNYNGLNVNLDKRFSHNFQFQVAYTFAKSLDDTSQTIAGDTFANSINSPWWFLPGLFYGPSDFNIAHILTVNGLYDIPTPKSWRGALNTALGGWELGGIFSFNSGTPTTPVVSGDPLGVDNSGADQFGPLVKIPGCNPVDSNYAGSLPGAPKWINANCYTFATVATSELASLPYPCAPFTGAAPAPAGRTYCANLAPGNVMRNSITGPHLFNLDFSVLKNFPVRRISEAFNIQFRAEMFNITNHDNFVPPQPASGDQNSLLYNTNGSPISTGGTISQLATDPREIQFALKMIW